MEVFWGDDLIFSQTLIHAPEIRLTVQADDFRRTRSLSRPWIKLFMNAGPGDLHAPEESRAEKEVREWTGIRDGT